MTSHSGTFVEFDAAPDAAAAVPASAGQVRFVQVPAQRFLAIDGTGPPGDIEFREAMSVLYPVAWTLHFALKSRALGGPIGSLEGVYWTDDATLGPPAGGELHWRLMIPIPPDAADADIDGAIAEVRSRKAPVALDRLHVVEVAHGPAAQVLHVGPYDREAATLERLRQAIRAAGLRPCGPHHEIYISDPNRTSPERLKTVIRQPVTVEGPG